MKYIQTFRTIGLTKLFEGEEYYSFTSLNNSVKNLIYRPSEDRFILLDFGRKEIEVRPKAKAQLLSTRKSFRDILCEIPKKDGTFHRAKSEHCLLAYRRELKEGCREEIHLYDKSERNNFYRFLLFLGNGTVLQYLCTVEDLVDRFDFTTLCEGLFLREKNVAAIKEGNFPFFQSLEKHDRYLWLSLKYLAGIATQEEADEAASVDGRTRFVPEEKIYSEGVTVSDVEQISPSFFARSERYSCTVTIDSRKWQAVWRPGRHSLLILQYTHRVDACIKISNEVYDSIQKQAVKKYLTQP